VPAFDISSLFRQLESVSEIFIEAKRNLVSFPDLVKITERNKNLGGELNIMLIYFLDKLPLA
jgi:hypothetical protein